MSISLGAEAPGNSIRAAEVHSNDNSLNGAAVSGNKRNIAVDILRGYCIVLMITSHTGTTSYVNNGLHLFRFVSGAEGFVFLAGLVLGMVYGPRVMQGPPARSYVKILRRAGMIWGIHCILTLITLALNPIFFHYADIPSLTDWNAPRLLLGIGLMQIQPPHLLNILPLYVFLLMGAPLALEALRRGRWRELMGISTVVFLITQWDPGLGSWVLPVSGGDAFPPLAWQILFLSGITVGFYRTQIRERIIEPYRQTLTLWLTLMSIALIILVTVQLPMFQFYDHERWDLYLWERHPLRFGRVIYFFLSISASYLLVQWAAKRFRALVSPFMALAALGKNSLYAFLVHIVIALAIGVYQAPPEQWIIMEIIPIATIVCVYLLAAGQVGRKWIPN